ncbi:alginate O-acetyltransferase [Dyella lipolytica]|uniref:Probable alginate O-acetylase n=1 Tax=Dyella lipolytica TaxID=1867835 RepID=A0ABW8IXP6_9GAMM|nr:MBOAT family O-acyltransferase [Dyella lipolytica]GLQ48017.1 alginate O-acetyltransferase [Dyella lipolytica]
MNFTSLPFLLALAVAIPITYFIPAKFKCVYLLALSYLFYFTWSVGYSLLLAATSLTTYSAALIISNAKSDSVKKWVVAGAISALLAVLVFFKYSEALAAIGKALTAPGLSSVLTGLVIPIGISYYLFKSISYVLDVYWGNLEASRDVVAVSLYIAFFPQILSGPIQRSPEFFKQISSGNFGRLDPPAFERAIGLLLLGFFEKLVVADHIGALVHAVDAAQSTNAYLLLIGVYGYTLQLFADFSGITHIAIGIGLFFGIEGPPNFNRPFRANNIQEYWRGWHMSLTTWLTDYLFMPLRLAMRNMGNYGLALSIMINMILIGIWHGDNWTFLVFGVIHGVFMICSALTLKPRNTFFKSRPTLSRLRKVYAPIVTFHMVCLALIFFRAPTVSSAVEVIRGIAHHQFSTKIPPSIGHDVLIPALVAAVIAFDLGTGYLGLNRLGTLIAGTSNSSNRRWISYGTALLIILLLASTGGGEFIYAKF